jgi:hypothetical protein
MFSTCDLDYEADLLRLVSLVFLARKEKKHYAEKNLYFRIILILDEASAHILNHLSLSKNRKVIFMPPTSAVMQLMGKCMITTFKLYYLCCTLKKLITETYVNN